MIRLGKPVQLFEWGQGTTTLNQNWDKIAEGVLRNKAKYSSGETTLIVEVAGAVTRKNESNDAIKVLQKGEVMTPLSDRWGEVAMGKLKEVKQEGGKTVVYLKLTSAAKIQK